MFKNTVNTSKTLRFKRWSRKRYAAFASMQKVVSIAALTVSVADKALAKAGSYLQSSLQILSGGDVLSESPGFEELENLLVLNAESQQQIITIQSCADACAAGASSVYSLLKATNKGNVPFVGRFFVAENLQIFHSDSYRDKSSDFKFSN
jgi:hypothetical protein